MKMSYIGVVSSSLPRKCGIATFSNDLNDALVQNGNEIRIAAIDRGDNLEYRVEPKPYEGEVVSVISQKDPSSYLAAARQFSDAELVIFQHEFGLDGEGAMGDNYAQMLDYLKDTDATTMVYLHTVEPTPTSHQKKTIQHFANSADGLLISTTDTIEVLTSVYGVARDKLHLMEHGTRIRDLKDHDRLNIKREWKMEDMFSIWTPGLVSPNKGIEYGIDAYALARQQIAKADRDKLIYVVAGTYHDDFKAWEGGIHYEKHVAMLAERVRQHSLKGIKVTTMEEFKDLDKRALDIIFIDKFLDDKKGEFTQAYAASNVILLPYRNIGQASSGIGAEGLGAGRIVLTGKSLWARGLLTDKPTLDSGIVGINDPGSRGILVDLYGKKDKAIPSVDQMAAAIYWLATQKSEVRNAIEEEAFRKGYKLRWDAIAWNMLRDIGLINDRKKITSGRGPNLMGTGIDSKITAILESAN